MFSPSLIPILRFSALLLLLAPGPSASDIVATINNETEWRDTEGNIIYCSGGNITEYQGTFYWVGYHHKTKNTNLYTSKTLSSDDWKLEGRLFSRDTYAGRPSLFRNPTTGKWVLFIKTDKGTWILHTDQPTGPFSIVKKYSSPDYFKMEDQSVFVEGNNAYICGETHNDNAGDRGYQAILKLNADWSDVESMPYRAKFWGEAPHIVKRGSYYYYFTSLLFGYSPSPTKYRYATSLSGPFIGTGSAANNSSSFDCLWDDGSDMPAYTDHGDSYDTQHDFILTVQGSQGTAYLYAGDRWVDQPGDYPQEEKDIHTRHLWLPVTWNNSSPPQPVIHYSRDWQLNVTKGTFSYGLANARPVIRQLPARKTPVVTGDATSIELVAENAPNGGTMSYQWYRGPRGDTSNPVAGASSATLDFTAITNADHGDYWCRVSNAFGTTDSPTSDLTNELVHNGGFQSFDIEGTDVLKAVRDWTTKRSDNLASFDTKENNAKIPGPADNQVLRLKTGENDGTVRQLDVPYPCFPADKLMLHFNASEINGQQNVAGNAVQVSILKSNWSSIWTRTVNLDGTHDGTIRGDWEPDQTFDFSIDASELTAAGVTKGDTLILIFEPLGNINWLDNVSLLAVSGAPEPEAVGVGVSSTINASGFTFAPALVRIGFGSVNNRPTFDNIHLVQPRTLRITSADLDSITNTFTIVVEGATAGTSYHVAANTTLSTAFTPVPDTEQTASTSSLTFTLAVDPSINSDMFFRIVEGAIP